MSEEYQVIPFNPAFVMTPLLLGESWRKALGAEFYKPYFIELDKFLMRERTSQYESTMLEAYEDEDPVYPSTEEVFAWSHYCRIQDVKVVFLGDNPDNGLNVINNTPGSLQLLKNIFDIEGFKHPGHGDLTEWAKQGVLLLNSVLTVRIGGNGQILEDSHRGEGWEQFTDAVIKYIEDNCSGVVFIPLGDYARYKHTMICSEQTQSESERRINPSYLFNSQGALVSKKPRTDFFSRRGCGRGGNRIFSRVNKILRDKGKSGINWKISP